MVAEVGGFPLAKIELYRVQCLSQYNNTCILYFLIISQPICLDLISFRCPIQLFPDPYHHSHH